MTRYASHRSYVIYAGGCIFLEETEGYWDVTCRWVLVRYSLVVECRQESVQSWTLILTVLNVGVLLA